MSQSLTQIYLHIVFSTKDRLPFLADNEFRETPSGYFGFVLNLTQGALEDSRPWAELFNAFGVGHTLLPV